MSSRAAWVLLPLLLWGCASTEKVPVSRARLEAEDYNRRGLRAAAVGETDVALREFAAARRTSSSVEDFDGTALALVNGARVARFANRTTHSRVLMEEALTVLPAQSDLYAEAAFERAKIALACGDLAGARQWAGRAVVAERGGRLKARLNLVGRIENVTGRYAEAESAVLKGLAVEGEPEEAANSERILAEVYLATGRLVQAREAYLAALAADTGMGLSNRIAADLKGLGVVAAKVGAPLEGAAYHRRAAAVYRARGERTLAAQQMKEAGRLLEAAGKKDEGRQAFHLGESYLNDPPDGNVMQKGGD